MINFGQDVSIGSCFYFRVIYYPFGDRDPKAEYTLQVGDWVQFNVATDRRDNLQRATNIELLFNSLTFSKEKREQVSVYFFFFLFFK